MAATDVMVIGGPAAGKTHYAGQLLGRLRHDRQGSLHLRPGGAESLVQLEEVLACLEEGRAAGHTPAETWMGIKCRLETQAHEEVLLEWPDYAGERLSSIVENRVLTPEWRESINVARAWMLFIRPATLRLHEDLLSRPTGAPPHHASVGRPYGTKNGWDDRAYYVELLQILLFAGGQSTYNPIVRPRLAVILSCWDELGASVTPEEAFRERMPLLHTFVRSTWNDGAWSVWGLSSLGRALRTDSRDEEFVAQGPEKFGYVIAPGTSVRNPDLTAPVAWLLEV